MAARLLITLPDYERVFRVIHGILLNEKGDPTKGCLYFAVLGAAILHTHFKIKARPVVGIAAFRLLSGSSYIQVFAEREGDKIFAGVNGFHAWVETDSHVIDFMAPIFPEVFPAQDDGQKTIVGRKMLQLPAVESVAEPQILDTSGTFGVFGNEQLTKSMLADFLSIPFNRDFIDIAVKWFKPAPKPISPSVTLANAKGEISTAQLSPQRVADAWR